MTYRIQRYIRKKVKIEKPYALGWGEWEKWENELRAARPVAYFFTETIFDWLTALDVATLGRLRRCRNYLVCRFIRKTHMIDTGLKKGDWHELDTGLLHGMFERLSLFVEHECAIHHLAFDEEERKKFVKEGEFIFWIKQRFATYRNTEAGLAYLEWEMSLDFPDEENINVRQAQAARETFALYKWWRFDRPTREDGMDKSGISEFHDRMDAKYGNWMFSQKLTAEEAAEQRAKTAELNRIDKEYEIEDEEMMIRLIKHRSRLWT